MRKHRMKVNHTSFLDTEKVARMFSERDGVAVQYVCTSALDSGNRCYDIFYRDTPHPEYGNKYFGLVKENGTVYITNADAIEGLEIACVLNDEGDYEYSRFRHDFKMFDNGNMIDGGRAYTRSTVAVAVFMVDKGKLVELVE